MRKILYAIGATILAANITTNYTGAQEKPNPRKEFIQLVDKYASGLRKPHKTSQGTIVLRDVPERGDRFTIDLKNANETLTASETLSEPKGFVFHKIRYFTTEERTKNNFTIDGYRYMRIDEVETGRGGCLYAGIPDPKTAPRLPEYDRVEVFAGRDCENGFWEDLARFTAALNDTNGSR